MNNLILAIFAGAFVTGCDPATDGEEDKTVTDADGDGFSADDDCDDDNADISPDATEACDGFDNNCDGVTDEAGSTGEATFYADSDADGFGDSAATSSACAQPTGYVADMTDCDDAQAGINPGAAEVCDGGNVDEDCSGAANDEDPNLSDGLIWYADGDQDGFGDSGSAINACVMQAGYVADMADCDDTNNEVNPTATEMCDTIDNDCDGDIDEAGSADEVMFYADMDADTYGDAANMVMACAASDGWVADWSDCDDLNGAINPAASEVCDGADNDCDTWVDDADDSVSGLATWYADADADAYGNATVTTSACDQPAGYVADMTDCNDGVESVNPMASELCDDADTDEDCDGLADDADGSVTGQTSWYVDNDGDGGGDNDTMMSTCDQPFGYVDNARDPYEDATFGALASDADLVEPSDIIVGSSAIYVAGFNSDGDPAVVSIDPSTGVVTEIWAGEPLVQPSGIALSADELTVYVADVGSVSALGDTNGGVYEIDIGGGSATEVGIQGTIDMPGDIAISADGATWYISGLNVGGQPAIFSADSGTGTVSEVFTGEPLVDPLALDVSPDGTTLYVLDSLASNGSGAILAFGTAGWTYDDELAFGIDIEFPGGLAADDSGEMLLYTSIRSGSLNAVTTDGLGFEVLDTSGMLKLPTGVAVAGEMAYVTDISADSDVYALSY